MGEGSGGPKTVVDKIRPKTTTVDKEEKEEGNTHTTQQISNRRLSKIYVGRPRRSDPARGSKRRAQGKEGGKESKEGRGMRKGVD